MMTAVQRYASLATALAVIVAASVGLAVGGDEQEATALRTPAPDVADTDTAGEDVPADTTDAPPATAPDDPEPNDPAPGPPAADPDDPERAGPPRAGTYTYRETSDGESRESTVRIVDQGDRRQEEVRDDIRMAVLWREDGKFVERTTFGGPGGGFECEWEPPLRELVLPLNEGTTWQVDGSCEVTTGVTFSFDGRITVAGAETLEIGGVAVSTWKLDSEATMTFESPQGSFEQDITSESWFAPGHGLYVRSVDVVEGTDPQTGQPSTTTTERELLSLEGA